MDTKSFHVLLDKAQRLAAQPLDVFPEYDALDKALVGDVPVPEEFITSDDEKVFLKRLITEIDSYYSLNKRLPTLVELRKQFPVGPLEPSLEKLRAGLIARGLPTYQQGEQSGGLDPEFVLAVRLILDFSDTRSRAAKIKEAGLTTKRFSALMKDPAHKEYYASLVKESFTEEVKTTALVELARGVERGELPFIKHFQELTGEYRPNAHQVANLQMIILGLMEILARHVQPEILNVVATEIDTLMTKELTA